MISFASGRCLQASAHLDPTAVSKLNESLLHEDDNVMITLVCVLFPAAVCKRSS